MKKNEKVAPRRIASSVLFWAAVGVVAFGIIWVLFCISLGHDVNRVSAADVIGYGEFFGAPEDPAEGVGRAANTTETHGNPSACVTAHADVLDYTDGVIWGWDGRYCELWEMDLYARILYLEFWGTSRECCEAGADSILRMLEAGYFGDSLGAVLSARAENGALVYSTYAYVWDWTYDPDGLAEMYALAVERFTFGPVWVAPFFQLWYYPAWAVPAYEIDGVYFSVPKG